MQLSPNDIRGLTDRQREVLDEHTTIWVDEEALAATETDPGDWLPRPPLELLEHQADTHPTTLAKRGIQHICQMGLDDDDPKRAVEVVRTLVEADRSMPSP